MEVASQARDRFGVNLQSTTVGDSDVHGSVLLRNMVGANMTFESEGSQAKYESLTDEELFSDMFVSGSFCLGRIPNVDFCSYSS